MINPPPQRKKVIKVLNKKQKLYIKKGPLGLHGLFYDIRVKAGCLKEVLYSVLLLTSKRKIRRVK